MVNNTNTAMVALDPSASYNTANYKILLDVLTKYFWKILNLYLTNRQFHVQIEDQFSDVKTLDSVLWGSILGPLLFTCYASTLQELLTNHKYFSGYTDNHSFIKVLKPIDHKMHTELELIIKNLSGWIHQNHLKMNNKETIFLTFGTRSTLKKEDLP